MVQEDRDNKEKGKGKEVQDKEVQDKGVQDKVRILRMDALNSRPPAMSTQLPHNQVGR